MLFKKERRVGTKFVVLYCTLQLLYDALISGDSRFEVQRCLRQREY